MDLVSYSRQITRNNPSAFLFLVDQSGSMRGTFGQAGNRTKADFVATALNKVLQNIGLRCAKQEGIRDYFHIGIIGYGATVRPALGGFEQQDLAPISQIIMAPARIDTRTQKLDDGVGGILDRTVKFPVWFDPVADGSTPMCEALQLAHSHVSGWVRNHPDSFPPIVLNISDGASTDGDPTPIGKRIADLQTSDGNVLFLNCHVSDSSAAPIEYPDVTPNVPDPYARQLFEMSSRLPEPMLKRARRLGRVRSEAPKGFVFNADMDSVVAFLDIGTGTTQMEE